MMFGHIHAWQFRDWKILGVVRSSSICSRIFVVSSSYWCRDKLTHKQKIKQRNKSDLIHFLLIFWNGIFQGPHNEAKVFWCQSKARIWITGKSLHNPEKNMRHPQTTNITLAIHQRRQKMLLLNSLWNHISAIMTHFVLDLNENKWLLLLTC